MSHLFLQFDPITGQIIGTGDVSDETRAAMVEQGTPALFDLAALPSTHYVDLTGAAPTLAEYTVLERTARAALAPGWVWQMPERIAVDQRTLDAVRTAKVAEMSEACAGAILAGFKSSVLGSQCEYPAKPTDQTNLAGSIIASLIAGPGDWSTPFWCADAAGDWAFRMHTAAQIQQVGRDGKAAILAAMTKNEILRTRIETATIAELDAMRWEN